MAVKVERVGTMAQTQWQINRVDDLVGESVLMQRLRHRIEAVALRHSYVLIEGETGTGKELVSRSIHAASSRSKEPFVPVDCTALNENLVESQLFGHVKGAFTGAEQDTLGFFRCADGGTLFLDEIGELPPSTQARLLRCIQERTVVPLGSVKPIRVDVRIVAATNRDLKQMAEDGDFRQDLYYRLNVVHLHIPPLRCRKDDISSLAHLFLDELAQVYDEPRKKLSPEAEAMLANYDWPGNVRQLNNAIENAFVFCTSNELFPVHFTPSIQLHQQLSKPAETASIDQPLMTLDRTERKLIAQALKQTGGNQTRAAKLLEVERHRLRRKIVRYDLTDLTRLRPR